MPTGFPSSSPKPVTSSGANSGLTSKKLASSTRASIDGVDVVPAGLVGRHQVGRELLGRRSSVVARRLPPPVVRQKPEERLGLLDRVHVVGGELIAATRHLGVHPGATHLLQADPLPHHHLGHPRRTQVHRRVPLDHDHQVAEGRDVRAPGRARPEQAADLRHLARQRHLVGEDPARTPTAREEVHLIGDPGPGRVDEPEDRQLVAQRHLGHPDDLLHRPGPPGTGLDRRVVGHHERGPAVHQTTTGDDAIGGQTGGLSVGQSRVLHETALVEEFGDSVADVELALSGELGSAGFGRREGAGSGGRESIPDVVHDARDAIPPANPARGRSTVAAPPRCPRRSPAPWRPGRSGQPGTPP